MKKYMVLIGIMLIVIVFTLYLLVTRLPGYKDSERADTKCCNYLMIDATMQEFQKWLVENGFQDITYLHDSDRNTLYATTQYSIWKISLVRYIYALDLEKIRKNEPMIMLKQFYHIEDKYYKDSKYTLGIRNRYSLSWR